MNEMSHEVRICSKQWIHYTLNFLNAVSALSCSLWSRFTTCKLDILCKEMDFNARWESGKAGNSLLKRPKRYAALHAISSLRSSVRILLILTFDSLTELEFIKNASDIHQICNLCGCPLATVAHLPLWPSPWPWPFNCASPRYVVLRGCYVARTFKNGTTICCHL